MMLVRAVLPLLNAPFIAAIAAGLVLFVMGTCSRSAKVAERLQFIGLCSCATGSVTILKGIAQVCLH